MARFVTLRFYLHIAKRATSFVARFVTLRFYHLMGVTHPGLGGAGVHEDGVGAVIFRKFHKSQNHKLGKF